MWLKILGVVVVVLVVLIAMVPNQMFKFLFGRPKRSTKIPKYYVDTPHYKVSRKGMAIIKNLPVEDVYLTSRDGYKLHAYYFPAEEPSNKFLLGIHGYRSYSRPEFGPYVEFYRAHGYNMLLPDDRAHAPSEGPYIGFGVLDRLDCTDWACYIRDRFGTDSKILLHGVSMGAATVLSASGEDKLPDQVCGIISDCGFSSAWEILHYQMKETMHLPADWILPRCEKICKKKAGFDFHTVTAIDQVKKAKVPILFVQGEKDVMVPPYMVDKLYEACASKKAILKVPEAGHGESIAFAPDEYHKLILEMFE